LCKDILDIRPTDTQMLGELNEVWDQPLNLWTPEYADPQEWHLEFAIRRGDDEAELARLGDELAENQRQITIKREIVDWRALHRFGLLFWILRNVRNRGDAVRWIAAWQTFAGYFGDVPRLAEILDKGIAADWEDRGRWSNWVLDTLPKRAVHGIAVDLEFIQTFVVLALSLVSPDGPPPQIDPLKFGRGRLEDPRKTVLEVIEIENLKPLLPSDRLDERAEVLITALETMLKTQKASEEQAVIDAPLDENLVRSFIERLRESWRTARTVRAAFAAIGGVEVVEGELGERSGSQVKRWLTKGLFVSESRVFGVDRIAADYGHGLARWEWNTLLRAAEAAPATAAPAGADLAATVRAAIAELRDAGYEPSLVVMPMNWRVFQALDMTPAPNRGGDAEPPAWLQDEDDRGGFLGTVDGVPVLEEQHVPGERLYVFDLGAFAKFRERNVEDPPGPVRVELTYYDEEALREMVRKNRVNFEEGLDEDARVRMLQQQVLLDAVYPFEIAVVDDQAARYLEVPPELRRL
jgi:hypothetical protein